MAQKLSFGQIWNRAKSVVVIFTTALFVFPSFASAQITGGAANVNAIATSAGVSGGADLMTIIGRIINVFLGLLGVIFLVLMLYAGFQWMTAGGDAAKVEKAKVGIRNAVIGLVILATAFAITNFIFGLLAGVTGDLGGVGSSGGGPGVGALRGSSGALGRGIIEMHYPPRNATGVPRNAAIIITFKEPIDPASFIQGWTETASTTLTGLNADLIKVYRSKDGEAGALVTAQARVMVTSDYKTVRIKPVEYLGSPTAATAYTVSLKGGKDGVHKKDGSAAFSGSFGSGYLWPFEVSTVVDLTPPKVVSATPVALGSYARNIVIQMTFNKPIDPISASGKTANIEVNAGDPGASSLSLVPGEFHISNQYQTVEFIPDVKCGTNSCGKDVFCLPGNKNVQVTAKSATIDPTAKPQAQITSSGFDGVVDVAGNSLDGNANGTGDGPPTDNYSWTFGTSDLLKLTPPQIESTQPGNAPGTNDRVPLDQPVKAVFDSILQSSTVNSENVSIEPKGPGEKNPDTFWWTSSVNLLTATGADISTVTSTSAVAAKAAIVIAHRPYLPSGSTIASLNYYNPHILSGVQDAYQNCFNPARACGAGDGGPNCCNGKTQTGACVFK